jgi:hypothetical protein
MLASSREIIIQRSLAESSSGEQLGLAVTAILMAVAIASWIYGVYCYIQMVRHRRPGVPPLSMMWPAQFLTERGREFRRRALLSYGVFAALGLLLILWGWLQR